MAVHVCPTKYEIQYISTCRYLSLDLHAALRIRKQCPEEGKPDIFNFLIGPDCGCFVLAWSPIKVGPGMDILPGALCQASKRPGD